MTTLTDDEIIAAMRPFTFLTGVLGDPAPIVAGAIALAESGGVTDVTGDNYASGHVGPESIYRWDDGLMQVNSVHGYDRARLLSDVAYNVGAATDILGRQGWRAWSTFWGGQYLAYLPRMRAAYARASPTLAVPLSQDEASYAFARLLFPAIATPDNNGVRFEWNVPLLVDGERVYTLRLRP